MLYIHNVGIRLNNEMSEKKIQWNLLHIGNVQVFNSTKLFKINNKKIIFYLQIFNYCVYKYFVFGVFYANMLLSTWGVLLGVKAGLGYELHKQSNLKTIS